MKSLLVQGDNQGSGWGREMRPAESAMRAIFCVLAAIAAPGCQQTSLSTLGGQQALTNNPLGITIDGTGNNSSSGSSTTTSTSAGGKVLVSWTPNRESAVNRAGGGYSISVSSQASFASAATTTLTVPFSNGATPNSAVLSGFGPGTYFYRVSAFSALPGSGPGGTAVSAPSGVSSFVVQ